MQGHCGTGPWNSISHSWEQPPGSYVSRFGVGFFCGMIGVFHALLYAAHVAEGREANAASRCCCCCSNELLLGVGLFSAFCLSWVGAICDADDLAMCMGNNSIHSTFAVLFFGLTDVVAVVLALDPKPEAARRPHERRLAAVIAAALGIATALAAAAAHGVAVYPGWKFGDNAVIIAEVTEVSIFLVWMNNTARTHFDRVSWAAVSSSSSSSTSDDGKKVVVLGGARGLAKLTTLLVVAVLGATLALYGGSSSDSDGGVPVIGDLWVTKPSNWISRWGLVQFASGALWVVLFSQLASASASASASILTVADWLVMALQGTAVVAAAGTAVVASTETAAYHAAFALVFAVAGNLGALASCLLDGCRASCSASPPSFSWVRCALAAVALGSGGACCLVGGLGPERMAMLQWVDVAALLAFYAHNCLGRAATANMGLAVVVADADGAGAAVAEGGYGKV